MAAAVFTAQCDENLPLQCCRNSCIARRGHGAVRRLDGGDSLSVTDRGVYPSAFTKVSALGIEGRRVNAVPGLEAQMHNCRIFARMPVWERQSCVQAPISALFRTGNDWAVFEVDGGRVRQQADTIGHMNEDVAEVAGGLEPGTTVVVHPNEA